MAKEAPEEGIVCHQPAVFCNPCIFLLSISIVMWGRCIASIGSGCRWAVVASRIILWLGLWLGCWGACHKGHNEGHQEEQAGYSHLGVDLQKLGELGVECTLLNLRGYMYMCTVYNFSHQACLLINHVCLFTSLQDCGTFTGKFDLYTQKQ